MSKARLNWLLLIVTIFSTSVIHAAEPFEKVSWKMDAPVLKPWKSFKPNSAYHGQWLVADDLDGDGVAEIVTARNDDQLVTTVVVSKLDGSELWHWGKPNTGDPVLHWDVPVQIHDLDRNGTNEVYISVKHFLLVLEGRTGKELRRLPLPDGLEVADCITFADLRGLGYPQDIIIKDRYRQLWAYTDTWKSLWHWKPDKYRTCHHPTLVDIDSDGRDEVMAGYTLLDDNGKELWTIRGSKANLSAGHLDCCDIKETGSNPQDFRLLVTYCGANCLALLDGTGKTLWEIKGAHFESVDAGRVRSDIPGKQIVVDLAHQPYEKAPLWLLDDKGQRLGNILCGSSRHHRLIDWNGDGLQEILIGNPRRLFNGKGECVARFGPDDVFEAELAGQRATDTGPLAAIGDLDGDQRPEIILHTAKGVYIYRSERAAKLPNRILGTGLNFTLY